MIKLFKKGWKKLRGTIPQIRRSQSLRRPSSPPPSDDHHPKKGWKKLCETIPRITRSQSLRLPCSPPPSNYHHRQSCDIPRPNNYRHHSSEVPRYSNLIGSGDYEQGNLSFTGGNNYNQHNISFPGPSNYEQPSLVFTLNNMTHEQARDFLSDQEAREEARDVWNWWRWWYMTVEAFDEIFEHLSPDLKIVFGEAILRYNVLFVEKEQVIHLDENYNEINLVQRHILPRRPLRNGWHYLDTDASTREGRVYIGVVLRDERGRPKWTATLVEDGCNMQMDLAFTHNVEVEGIFMACRKLKSERPDLVEEISGLVVYGDSKYLGTMSDRIRELTETKVRDALGHPGMPVTITRIQTKFLSLADALSKESEAKVEVGHSTYSSCLKHAETIGIMYIHNEGDSDPNKYYNLNNKKDAMCNENYQDDVPFDGRGSRR